MKVAKHSKLARQSSLKAKKAQKKVHKQSKRSMAGAFNERTLPGTLPLLHPDVQQTPLYVAEQQHGRQITELQTHEDQYLLSAILEPNTYTPKMILSNNLDQAKAHTRSFYRKILRILPALCKQYGMMELHPKELVPVIRSHFKKHGEITSYQVMDALRWEAEVEFSDVVRMFFTQTNVFSALFPDMHHAQLPRLPPSAAPSERNPILNKLQYKSSTFLQEFLDPTLSMRKERAKLPECHSV